MNRSRARARDLEPDAEAAVAIHAPAVREPVEQHEPVAAGPVGVRSGRGGSSKPCLVAHAQAHALVRTRRPPSTSRPDAGVAVTDAVARQLGDEQLDVVEPLGRRARRSGAHARGGAPRGPRRPAGEVLVPTAHHSSPARRGPDESTRVRGHTSTRRERVRSRVPPSKRIEVEIGGRMLSLSNLDKPLYPEAGFTKGHVIDYYSRVAPVLLPHLRGRPLTLKRYPNGVDGATSTRSSARRTGPTGCRPRRSTSAATGATSTSASPRTCRRSCGWPTWPTSSCTRRWRSPPTRASPTILAFDLDPGPPATAIECAPRGARAARGVRPLRAAGVPEDVGLEGHAGLRPAQHARAPTTGRSAFSQALAQLLERRHPRARRVGHEQGAARGQGVRRLEPERRAQDDGVRVLAAGDARGRRSRRRCAGRRSRPPWSPATPRSSRSPPTRCSSASPSTATCSRPW